MPTPETTQHADKIKQLQHLQQQLRKRSSAKGLAVPEGLLPYGRESILRSVQSRRISLQQANSYAVRRVKMGALLGDPDQVYAFGSYTNLPRRTINRMIKQAIIRNPF